MFKSRKGQGWIVDYAISILIFIVAALLATKLITNALSEDIFSEVEEDAVTISEHLLSPGNPVYWNNANVVRIGLTTSKNRLNKAKLKNFISLDYNYSRDLLGTRYNYAFYLEDRNRSLIGIRDQCALGSPSLSEVKNMVDEVLPVAYYFKDETFLAGEMTSLGADFYDADVDADVNSFYNNLSSYDLVVLENSELADGGSLTIVQKQNRIDEYVLNGGLLFMTENVSINLTGVGFTNATSVDGDVVDDDDEFLELTIGRTIADNDYSDPSFTVQNIDADNFSVLAEYQGTAAPMVAKWDYGVGKSYYFATANADYMDGAAVVSGFNAKIGEGAENYANVTVANCTSIGTGSIEAENIARIERLGIYDSEIIRMVVLAWD